MSYNIFLLYIAAAKEKNKNTTTLEKVLTLKPSSTGTKNVWKPLAWYTDSFLLEITFWRYDLHKKLINLFYIHFVHIFLIHFQVFFSCLFIHSYLIRWPPMSKLSAWVRNWNASGLNTSADDDWVIDNGVSTSSITCNNWSISIMFHKKKNWMKTFGK